MSDLKYGGSAILGPGSQPTGQNYSDQVIAEIRRRMALLNEGGFKPVGEVSALSPQYSIEVGEPQMPPQYSLEVGPPEISDSPQMQDSVFYGNLEQRGLDMVGEMDEDERRRKAALASMGGQ